MLFRITAVLSTLLVLFPLTFAHAAPNTAPPLPLGVVGTFAPADFYVTDIDVDAAGNVYAADLLQKHVTKYASDGTQLLRIADPEFSWPRTLTVDASGQIYVLDNTKGTIRVFSGTTGDLLSVWNGFDCAGELDADNLGRILVSMNGNVGCSSPGSEVIVLDLTGTELFRFGTKGSGPGQFDRNYGITSGSDGTIAVTDINNQRFQTFDSTGNYLFDVGSFGSDSGQFNGPRAPAIDSAGNIFISDRRNDRIQKFDATGLFLTMWGSRGTDPGQFLEMDGIETGPDDTLWVAGYHAHDIQHFANDGTFIERWKGHESGPGEFFDVKGIGVTGGKLFAVDGNNQRVQVFDSASGAYLYEFGERNQGDDTVFNFPRALATGPNGDIYVTDDDNIRRIQADGTFVKRYDRLAGLRSGSLGLVVSAGGVIYQSDTGNHRINKIDSTTGELLGQWGSNGTGPGQFKGPRGIALDSAGRVYVADTGNSRVQVFDANGVYQEEWFSSAPRALAIDTTNDLIYVGQWAKVLAYSMTGVLQFSWTGNGGTDGTFKGVVDIVLEQDGEVIHVADGQKGRIQRFAFSDIVYGQPQYVPGNDLGVFIWQDEDDGEWHVRFSGDNAKLYSYSIQIGTTSSFLDVRTYSLESGDVFQQTQQSLTLSGAAQNDEDGFDFFVAGASSLTFTVTIDGQTEDLDIFVGTNRFNPLNSIFQLTDSTGDLRPSQSILFAEVTAGSGVSYTGESWGSSWGNLDGDPYPDLWVTNHKACPSLFRNLGDGTFEDVAGIAFPLDFCSTRWHDAHGAAWADFDNDGDQDLIQLVDNGENNIPDPNQLFVNESGNLTDLAAIYGLDYQMGRGRTPLWLDWNNDGLLDLLNPTSRRGDGIDIPTGLLQQDETGLFQDVAAAVGLGLTSTTDYVLLSELNGDNRQELLVKAVTFPRVVYETSTTPFVDIRDTLGFAKTGHNIDAVAADFNGDLIPDIYHVQGETTNEVIQVDSTTVEVGMAAVINRNQSISFQMTGDLTVEPYPAWRWQTGSIFIGAAGSNPASIQFTASSADSATWGAPTYVPGTDSGMFLWFDPATGRWTLDLSDFPDSNLVLTSTGAISDIQATGFDINEQPQADRLYLSTGAGYAEVAAVSGITQPSSGRNIGVGDFDNDMDIDLYVVATGRVANRPNILYENLGDGTFQTVAAYGAEGSLLGHGDAVSVADYDLDGFLDLFVTNGKSKEPFDLDGPSQLFRNQGNSNHWLEIDLQGVESNRDGIGARLFLTAGGITQLREQNGGAHFRVQNHQRIHFGLGQNERVDRLEIRWPNGTVQVIKDIVADQLMQVVEGADGDLAPWNNPDGLINAADVAIASQLALGRRTPGALQYTHGDMNADGIINAADVLLVTRASQGLY